MAGPLHETQCKALSQDPLRIGGSQEYNGSEMKLIGGWVSIIVSVDGAAVDQLEIEGPSVISGEMGKWGLESSAIYN